METLKIKHVILILIPFTIFLAVGCNLVIGTNSALEIVVKGEQFTLAWDPGGPEIPNDPEQVVSYNVYYRVHGLLYWNYLTTVNTSLNPGCIITRKDLDYGRYDFAVRSVDIKGTESAFHSSLDITADPFTGWYVNWIGSK